MCLSRVTPWVRESRCNHYDLAVMSLSIKGMQGNTAIRYLQYLANNQP